MEDLFDAVPLLKFLGRPVHNMPFRSWIDANDLNLIAEAGLEPALPKEGDFKSPVSAISTTRPSGLPPRHGAGGAESRGGGSYQGRGERLNKGAPEKRWGLAGASGAEASASS